MKRPFPIAKFFTATILAVAPQASATDGTNSPTVEAANEKKFRNTSNRLHDELLRRARWAADRVAIEPPSRL